jgi:GT2 family glycosyltransferase
MRLSVIIVNYNVQYFLEQALLAVERAAVGLSVEVWVVDNASRDGSIEMLRERFDWVKVIDNQVNTGFAVANNQAMREATGDYFLLLNPDTVIAEDTFRKCLAFADAHPNLGGLGVTMIDGAGIFLPESKRGFPSPWVAFCKAFGLSAIFPRSAWFNHYHLGYLDAAQTHRVEVLSGAFMWLRKTALDKIGLLDEAFFMYGEDIDWSYRLIEGGYDNYYFADTTIIHYKGESTKKGSLNYVRTFYQAMIIFARKHFVGSSATIFVSLMQVAIWFRASLTLVGVWARTLAMPLLDAVGIFGGLLWLKHFWANYYFSNPNYYLESVIYFNFPLYIFIWLTCIYLSGGYDRPLSLRRLLRGVLVGTVLLAAVYGLLDASVRPSRALVLLGAAWTMLATVVLRYATHFLRHRNFALHAPTRHNLVIVGSDAESRRVRSLLSEAQVFKNLIGIISPNDAQWLADTHLGTLAQLDDLVALYDVEEIIFCSRDLAYADIIAAMQRMAARGRAPEFKIVAAESPNIIGSSNKNARGERYTLEVQFALANTAHRRSKRLLDMVIAVGVLLFSPLLLLLGKKIFPLLSNVFAVLLGKKTWIGYAEGFEKGLPKLPRSVWSPKDWASTKTLNTFTLQRLHFLYAKDYDLWRDLAYFWRSWRK